MNPSTLQFIQHLSKQDTKTLSQKALKTCDEVGCLANVVLSYDNAPGNQHLFVERQAILEEAVDVILCALSTAYDIGFTDEEIDQMMSRKTDKWAKLQHNEKAVQYPLPYEIHITVAISSEQIDDFRQTCATIGVKPIILELQNKQGDMFIDVMTSSKHYGDNRSAYEESERIVQQLKEHQYVIKRSKIETVPWHPAAPQHWTEKNNMPKDCYFESHIPIILPADSAGVDVWSDEEGFILGHPDLHISKNVLKRTIDGNPVIMATLRDYDTNAERFTKHVEKVVEDLKLGLWGSKAVLGKYHIEFSIYDTSVSHDKDWMS